MLADSREGQQKEAEVTPHRAEHAATRGNIRHGFVYERVPHITLKSIANNAEIDVIWDKWQTVLEPLREQLNTILSKGWQEWEIPARPSPIGPSPPQAPRRMVELASEGRRRSIASIAAKAEFEYLYDKPYEDKKKVRVAGPFTVENPESTSRAWR